MRAAVRRQRYVVFVVWSIFLVVLSPVAIQASEYTNRLVDFNCPDGAYDTRQARQDFGNGSLVSSRRAVSIKDEALRIRFVKGMKVDKTGVCFTPAIPPRPQYTLEYRIKYDANFEPGLHGKQIGFSGGRGYTGGLGEPCRQNGDGWSVRLQFDAHADEISNQLYVYHCEMKGAYGESLGTHRMPFYFKRGEWHQIKLRVTMQSSPTTRDGGIAVWCDGVKKIDLTNVRFVSQEAGRVIDRLRLESFPGGAGIVPTRDSYLEVDDMRWDDVSETNLKGGISALPAPPATGGDSLSSQPPIEPLK